MARAEGSIDEKFGSMQQKWLTALLTGGILQPPRSYTSAGERVLPRSKAEAEFWANCKHTAGQ